MLWLDESVFQPLAQVTLANVGGKLASNGYVPVNSGSGERRRRIEHSLQRNHLL